MADTPAVYAAISAVTADLAKDGIAKDKTVSQGAAGTYKFRGIDDVYNVLAMALVRAGLVVVPRFLSRQHYERAKASGGNIALVVVEAEFDFVAVADGSKHTARTFGEAMDSGDKATNKAMSAAYKYVCFQTFSIPTEGDNDADATNHVLAGPGKVAPKASAAVDEKALLPLVDECNTVDQLNGLWKSFTPAQKVAMKDAMGIRKTELTNG